MIGTRIVHYQITSKLGQGGMGEVYRATDTKLDRDVAIKVLPESFAQNQERLARFEREAKTLATLNHTNIAGIYGLEQTQQSQALILELVEGDDLSEQLKCGPLPIEGVLKIGMQVAEALEAAHEKSIIHRDLKPGNIKISSGTKVKVLDFGLAKALCDEEGTNNLEDSNSPTITDAFTQPGTILGTAAYMSPEQARGKHIDERSDIWAFGCVIYECLTGTKPFKGADITETLASIIKSEPDWDALPAETPVNLQLLIRKCLTKDINKRLQHIDDARIDLEQCTTGLTSQLTLPTERQPSSSERNRSFNPLFVIGVSVLLLLTGFGVGRILQPESTPNKQQPNVRQLSISSGAEVELLRRAGTAVKFSPDGEMVGFISSPQEEGGTSHIYLRRLDQLTANLIPGTEGADLFCFSPDGKQIAFRNQNVNELQVIPIQGGTTSRVCISKYPGGLDWGKDGNLYFAEEFGPIYRVSLSSGIPKAVTELSGHERSHRWPSSVGVGKGVLFSAGVARGAWKSAKLILKRFSDENRSEFSHPGRYARLLPQGFLVFGRDGQLFGVPFSMDSLEFSNNVEPVPLVKNVSEAFGGISHFDVSHQGNLVYLSHKKAETKFTIDWIHRDGTLKNILQADTYNSFRLSPNGDAIAYGLSGNIWVYHFERRIPTNLSFGKDTADIFPIWSPSGKSVFFTRFDKEGMSILWRRVDQSSGAQTLTTGKNVWFPWAFHPEANKLICYFESSQGLGDQRILNLEGDDISGWKAAESIDLFTTAANEVDSSFSTEGTWLAYSSNEPGKHQIYITNATDPSARLQLTSKNFESRYPIWAKGSNELLFGTRIDTFQTPFSVQTDDTIQVYIAPFSTTGKIPNVDVPVPWPEAICSGRFDIHPDGQRILVRRKVAQPEVAIDQINFFEGFTDSMKEHFPDANNVLNSH